MELIISLGGKYVSDKSGMIPVHLICQKLEAKKINIGQLEGYCCYMWEQEILPTVFLFSSAYCIPNYPSFFYYGNMTSVIL